MQGMSWIYAGAPDANIKNLSGGQPLLVRRLDREHTYYYLVPFNVKGQTHVVVIVDAVDGRFKEFSPLRPPGIFPGVKSAQAEKIVIDYLRSHAITYASPAAPPCLVWKPCKQTQSPYAPLWCIRINEILWFVDQDGRLHTQITDLSIKGGGPP